MYLVSPWQMVTGCSYKSLGCFKGTILSTFYLFSYFPLHRWEGEGLSWFSDASWCDLTVAWQTSKEQTYLIHHLLSGIQRRYPLCSWVISTHVTWLWNQIMEDENEPAHMPVDGKTHRPPPTVGVIEEKESIYAYSLQIISGKSPIIRTLRGTQEWMTFEKCFISVHLWFNTPKTQLTKLGLVFNRFGLIY